MSAARHPSMRSVALAAKAASRTLAPLELDVRDAALEAIARALDAAREPLLAANREDIASATSGAAALPAGTLARLKMDDAKLDEMIAQVRSVAALPDPLGRTLDAIELDDADPESTPAGASHSYATPSTHVRKNAGLRLRKISVPLGVVAVIFEARPDAVTQIAALALKSGNAVMLKPGSEVERTAQALVKVIRGALVAQSIAVDAVTLVLGRERTAQLLREHALVDMVIPRGSKALVEYVQAHTRIPVLGHAEGVCHIYVDAAADEKLALSVIADAKCDYPAACNAVETVLVHRAIAKKFLPKLARRLQRAGVTVHACGVAGGLMGEVQGVGEWGTEYGSLDVSVRVVESVEEAIAHIHEHGSSHTESILTEDIVVAERFLREVDAAGVFHNVSTRFADGFRYGFGAEVGVSTSKFHARGPVGMEGLTTYKYVLRGNGHVVGDYRGKGARGFTHRRVGA